MKRKCENCYFEDKGHCNYHGIMVEKDNLCDNHSFTTEICGDCENRIADCDCEEEFFS